MIAQDVGPRLQKLKDDRSQYLEYQKVQREVDHLSRIYIAWKFQTAQVCCSASFHLSLYPVDFYIFDSANCTLCFRNPVRTFRKA